MKQTSWLSLGSHNNIRIIDSSQIRTLVSMDEAIVLMEKTFMNMSNGKCYMPLRTVVEHPDKTLSILLKTAFDNSLNRFAIKLLFQNENNKTLGLPTITGMVFLMDCDTGKVLSIMDGETITALRTGAISGVVTKYLARSNSKTLALFGCGVQGRSQVEAILAVQKIEKVYFYDVNPEAGEKILNEFRSKYSIDFEFTRDLDNLKSVDIICTATGAKKPVFYKSQIKEGVHINAIGSYKPDMNEIDPEILKAASIYVDHREASLVESGDLIIPIRAGLFNEQHLKGEIGDLLTGSVHGRTTDTEITVFKSVGIAAQDLYLANGVYDNLQNKN